MKSKADKPQIGQFSSGLTYVALGTDGPIVFFALGGPGNDLPSGLMLKMYRSSLAPLLAHFRVYLVTRRSGLPAGYTTVQMADDYAEVIQKDLGGKIHAIVGLSYGGMILQQFCARHPTLVQKFVILSATHHISEPGLALDLKFAELLSTGQTGKAYSLIMEAVYPKGAKRALFKGLMRVMGPFMGKHDAPTFSEDVLIEAQAEADHGANLAGVLEGVQVPVAIVGGDRDFYFPVELYDEMHRRIPRATLKIFHGKGHDVFEDPNAMQYIAEYLSESSA